MAKSPFVVYEDETGEDCAFNCACGNIISPDDFSSSKYIVLDSVMNEGQLKKVIVKCLRCSAEIEVQLTEPHKRSLFDRTFDFLEDIMASRVKRKSSKPIRNGSSL
jgi:hypothetical protein